MQIGIISFNVIALTSVRSLIYLSQSTLCLNKYVKKSVNIKYVQNYKMYYQEGKGN